jgi:hypothetical protein
LCLCIPLYLTIKQKRTGRIKGKGCSEDHGQKVYQNKEEASFPTVANESVMVTSAIDAAEDRDVATLDISGVFMQADEIVHM